MAGWFNSGKVDHPLADPKASRQMISELPQDTFKALGEVAYWLDSVHATDGFRADRRFEVIDELDQYARPRLRKLAQDYLQMRQQKFQENRLWVVQADFWRLAGAGYVQCAEAIEADVPGAAAVKTRLALIVGRALRAIGQQLKWSLLRYAPMDAAVWGAVGWMYALAEAKGFADKPIALYDAGQGETSARLELKRILMLSAASADSMTPEQAEIAERSVALFAHDFLLEPSPEAGCTHVFDLKDRKPPARPHGASMEESMRYFGAGKALDEMDRLLGILVREGALPKEINLRADYDPQTVAEVWRHLMQYWALSPPERGSDRRSVKVTLAVMRGFANLLAAMDPTMANLLDFGPEGQRAGVESWIGENASDAGYGAVIPGGRGDSLQIGNLLGLKGEGDRYWSVGVIRRLTRDAESNRYVGIELLTRAPIAVRLAPIGSISPTNAIRENEPAVLLTRQPDDRRIRLLLRAGAYTHDQQLELRVRGQLYRLGPSRNLESAAEFDHGEFRVLQRTA